MRTILRVIDSVNEWAGQIACWFWVVLVLVMTNEVIRRYVFNSPTEWGYETSMMIGAATYALAWGYVHEHHAHVRVDVIYTRLSPRGRAIVDVVGSLLLFFPLLIILTDHAFAWTWHAWVINEKSVETYWYPPVAPLRTAVLLGLFLFGFQQVAQFIRDFYLLIRNKPYD
ncbi:MAG TPA: TRAP transporter small permease subunit [Dehalococcoidales bacterium]|nr:TRAP transporter small permease subunit [Dehalococcoidales bacterium]